MQSPFQLVRGMASIFCRYSQFVGSSGKCVRFLSFANVSRNGNSSLSLNVTSGNGGIQRHLHGTSDNCTNYSYNCPFREGSLFEFAASSSVIWPVAGAGGQIEQRRHLFGWLNSIFNRLDYQIKNKKLIIIKAVK